MLVLTKDNFKQEVLDSRIPVLVDFWAVWCGPCRMLAPTVEELAKEYEGKVNVDDEGELAMQFRISSIPTLMLFKNGKPVETMIGVRPKEQIAAVLDA